MKQITALILVVVMIFSCCACGSKAEAVTKDSRNSVSNYTEEDFYGTWVEVGSNGTLMLERGTSKSHFSYDSIAEFCMKNDRPVIGCFPFDRKTADIEIDGDGNIAIVFGEYRFVRHANLPKEEISMGEKGKDDSISIVLNGCSFAPALPDDLYKSLRSCGIEYGDDSILDDGQVYACLDFTIQNISKTTIVLGTYDKLFQSTLVYDNDFMYDTEDAGNIVYFYDGKQFAAHLGSSWGLKQVDIQPLAKKNVTLYMRIPEIIAEETDVPLNVIVTDFYSGIASRFDISIR